MGKIGVNISAYSSVNRITLEGLFDRMESTYQSQHLAANPEINLIV